MPSCAKDSNHHNDLDYFKVQVPVGGGGDVTFTTTGEMGASGRLFDHNGILLVQDPNQTTSGLGISASLEEGTYCLEVSTNRATIRGTVQLQIQGPIRLAGSCSAEHVSISTDMLPFGQMPVGSISTPQTVSVMNISANPQHRLFVEPAALSGINTAAFGILNDTCASSILAPEEECYVSGLFAPLSEGMKSAVMTIPCNDLDTLPLEVDMSGEGVIEQ